MKYPAYPSYKESGVQWLGEVPAGWEVRRVKTLLARNDGGVWGEGFDDNGVIILRSTEQTVNGEWKIVEPAKRQLSADEYTMFRLREGDLVVTKSSGSSLHIGKTSIVTKEVEALNCCYSNFMQRLRVKDTFMPRFVWYVLNGALGRMQFDYYSNTTTGLANLNGGVIGNINIVVAPLNEQHTIANFLDRETGRIDTLVAKKRRLIELLKEKRVALISRAVTRGLPADAAREFNLEPHTRFKDTGIEWLGEVPEGWTSVSLKWVSRRYTGGTPDKSNATYWEDGDIPWLNSGSVNDGYITSPSTYITQEGFLNSSAKWIPEKSLVMALAGQGKTKGMVAQLGIRATCNQSMAAIITKPNMQARYLYWWLVSNYQNIRNIAGGEQRDGLNLNMLGSILCPYAPLTEQTAIATYLDRETGKIDRLIEKINTAIDRLQEYRAALITAAVTGKIDVRRSAA